MLMKKIWISPQKARSLCRSLGLVRQGTLMPVKYKGVLGSLGYVIPQGYYVEIPEPEVTKTLKLMAWDQFIQLTVTEQRAVFERLRDAYDETRR